MNDARNELPNLLVPRGSTIHRLTPIVRCLSYLGGAAALVQGIGSLGKHRDITNPLLSQSLLLGAGTLWTALFLKQEQRPLSQLPLARRASQVGVGALLGSTAFGLLLAIGRARGDISIGSGGANAASRSQVARTVASSVLTHACVAWNEELVFRGYGFDVAQAAVGQKAASAGTLVLFGLYHEWCWQVFLGQVSLGAALLAGRLLTGDMWLSLGYHWAWNVMQTGIIGPEDGPPAPLTLRVHGPRWLIGRPGHPEPGALTALVNLGVAALAWAWRRGR